MVKRDGHIDLVFRDGLKSLEVLPPADVWDNVYTEITSPKSSAWVFRIAAGVAAIISLGLLAFFVGMRTSGPVIESLNAGLVQDPENIVSFGADDNNEPMLAELAQEDIKESQKNISTDTPIVERNTIDKEEGQLTASSPSFANNRILNSEYLDIMQGGKGSAVGLSSSIEPSSTFLIPIEYNSGKEIEKSKWMLGAKISPTYLSSNLKADNNLVSGQAPDESALLSYTGGLSVIYSVGSRFSLQTGIYYSSLGRQVSDINSYSGYAGFSESKGGKIFGVSTSLGTIASTNNNIFLVDASGNRITSIASARNFDPDKAGLDLYGSSLRQSFEYIEVPFMLSYKLIDKKVDFNIMGGMSYSLLLDNKVYAVSEGSVVPIGSMEDLAGLLLSSSFGMSMHYSLNDNFSLNLEPSIRYFLNSDGSLSASNNPFVFGIFSGVYYKF